MYDNEVQEIMDKIEWMVSDLEVEHNIVIDYSWNFVSEGTEVSEVFRRPNF